MEYNVFITPHARQRMTKRGGDPVLVAAAVRAAAFVGAPKFNLT